MHEQATIPILARLGAIVTNDHFVYTSGKHGNTYINKDLIYTQSQDASVLYQQMIELFISDGIDTIIGPEKGGIILAQWSAYYLGQLTHRRIYSTYAEKAGSEFVVRSAFLPYISHKRLLIVEDILTTGKTVRKVADMIRSLHGTIVGVSTICNRGNISEKDLGVPSLCSLVHLNLETWDQDSCPLCKRQVPINTKLGHGKAFLDKESGTSKM